MITSGGWLSVPLNATSYCCMILTLTIIPKVRFGYEVGVGYNYLISNTHEWNNCFIKTPGYYNWIVANFILNITKRPDINVTSGKPRGNHMTCDLVEWKIWKGRTLYLSYSLDKYCFRFPSLWLWNSTLDRSTWLPFTQENGVKYGRYELG